MARARNIKPGFFKNEYLAECAHGVRLLFAGLWCMADREGRLEDRPMKIKGELFPYESVDIDQWLNDLQCRKFLIRYSNGDHKYIQILNFKKHQNPHMKEPESSIPEPGKPQANPADSLIPDSLIPEVTANAVGKSAEADALPPCPFSEIVEMYHETLPMCPKVAKLTDNRKSHVRARWRNELSTTEKWRNYFTYVSESLFLTGRKDGNNGRPPFLADFDWLIKPSNVVKVAEGKYHRSE